MDGLCSKYSVIATPVSNETLFDLVVSEIPVWLSHSLILQNSDKRVPEKHVSALLTMPKPLTVWIIVNCGKF